MKPFIYKKLAFFVVCSCLQLVLTYAQYIPFQRYNVQNGFPVDRVTTIAQDEQGYMWFGSPYGLYRYNGISFESISLPKEAQNKTVTSIVACNGKIYAGFFFGGGLVEFYRGKTTAYHIRSKDSPENLNVHTILNNEDGNLLVATHGEEVFLFNKGVFTPYLSFGSLGSIQCLLKDAQQNLWVGTDKGLFIVQKNKAITQLYPGYNVFSLQKNNEGRIAVGIYNGDASVIYCNDVEGNKLKDAQTIACPRPTFPLPSLGNFSKGFWGINAMKSIFNIDPSGNIKFYKLSANIDADFFCFFTDRENNVWASFSPGIVKISNFSSTSYHFDELANSGGSIIRINPSTIWVSNIKEIYRIEDGVMNKVQKQGQLEKEFVGLLLSDSDHNIWIGRSNKDVWKTRWNGKKLIQKKVYTTFQNKKLEGPEMEEDKEGNLWQATFRGIFRIKDGTVQEHFRPVFPSGDSLWCINIEIDRGRHLLWLGDLSKGIIKAAYYKQPDGSYTYKVLRIIGKKDGLDDTNIRSLLLDNDGTLWAGTRFGGLFKITEDEANKVSIRRYGTEQGLGCTRVNAIIERYNNIVLGTCNGVYAYDKKQERFRHYSSDKGLQNAEVFRLATEGENEVWALTTEGITRFAMDEKNITTPGPLVSFTAIIVEGEKDTAALYSTNKKLSYHNSIGFVFTANSFIDEKKVLYKYQLEGFDKTWNKPTADNSINYTSLSPGKYKFRVLACNANGLWGVTASTFAFEIDSPFYRESWFIVACLLIPIVIFFTVKLIQLQQKIAIEKLRVHIARDLHDDIGSALGSVNILSQTAQRRLMATSQGEGNYEILSKISTTAQHTLDSMDDIIWTINPDKEKYEDLVLRMREFAIPSCESKNIEFKLHADLPETKAMSLDLKKNAFLIFKEAVNNSLKYSNCRSLIVETHISKNTFFLKIVDDGQGFDCVKTTARSGLVNMKKRASEMGGNLLVNSAGHEGTSVEFICPIK